MKTNLRKVRKAVACVLFVAAATLFVLGAFMDGDAIGQI